MANATFTGNGTGANLYGYMHARVVAERTDSTTSSSIVVKCYAVSDGGSSSFISGKASKDASGTLGSASSEMSVGSGGTTLLKTEAAFTVARGASAKTVPAKAQIIGGGTGMYSGRTDTATVNVPVPALASYAVTYDGNRPSTASGDVSGVPEAQTKWAGTGLALSSASPVLANHNFLGWATTAARANAGTVDYAPGSTYTGNAALSLYAAWELAYMPPSITSATCWRSGNDRTRTEDGTYANVLFAWSVDSSVDSGGNAGSSATVQYRRKGDSAWTTARTLALSGQSGSYLGSSSLIVGGSLDTGYAYEVRITVADTHGGSNYAMLTLSPSFTWISANKDHGIAVGKLATASDLFDVGIPASFDGLATLLGGIAQTGGAVTLDAAALAAWLSALGLATESVTFTANTTNWAAHTTNVKRSGKVVSVPLTGEAKAGAGTWQNETYTIGTLGVGADAFTELVAIAQISGNYTPILCAVHTDGKIYLRTSGTAVPANCWMWISGTYITG